MARDKEERDRWMEKMEAEEQLKDLDSNRGMKGFICPAWEKRRGCVKPARFPVIYKSIDAVHSSPVCPWS